jgi:hypothetical protein
LLLLNHRRPRAGPNRTRQDHSRQASPPHSGTTTAHSTQFHTHGMTTLHPSPELAPRTAAADHHPPNHLHRLKEHAHHADPRPHGRKLSREVRATSRWHGHSRTQPNQAHPQTASRTHRTRPDSHQSGG